MRTKKSISAIISIIVVSASVFLTGCSESKKIDNSGKTTSSSATIKDSDGKENITVWTPEELTVLTQEKLDVWLSEQADFNGKYTITVSAMGEGEVATQLITDVEAGADVYGFAQDQLARLVAAGALSAPGGVFKTNIETNNNAGSVSAATLDDKIYAYPETSDNGFFLYYDKSVVTDTSTLDGIIEQCAAADKNFYMDIQSGWYNAAFFFATGAECYYEYDTDGNVSSAVCDYNSEKGLKAFKAMIDLASNPNFSQSTSYDAALFDPNGGTAGAIVSGTWDSKTVSELLGDNMGACKLPTFNVDGETFQMSGFGGFKLVGVKPQTESDKLTFCHMIADYLTSEEMQLARFESNGWSPSNLNVQECDEVKSNITFLALTDQLQYCIPQGQYPNAYWELNEAFGTDINSGKYKNASDTELLKVLEEFEESIRSAK